MGEKPRKWLRTEDLAERFHTSPSTIRYWKHIGYGPPATRFGRRNLYDEDLVAEWEANRVEATAQG